MRGRIGIAAAGTGLAGLSLIGRRRVTSLARSLNSSHHRRDGS